MSERTITVEFIDENITFQVCFDLFDNTKSYYYSTKLGEYEADRFEYKREVSTAIYYDYLMLGSCGISKKNWVLSFHDKKQKEPNFYITKRFEEISYTYFDDNNKITKIAHCPENKESCKADKEENKSPINFIEEANKIYAKAIKINKELYDKIIDKVAFKEQLIDCITGLLEDSSFEIDSHLDNYFVSFINSEKELPKIKQIYDYNYFINNYKELKFVCSEESVLRDIITRDIERFNCQPNIFYSRTFVENELLSSINLALKQYKNKGLTKECVIDKIKELFEDKIETIRDKSDFFKRLELIVLSEMSYFKDWSISEILVKADKFIDEYLRSETRYYSFISYYGGTKKSIFLTSEKKAKFLITSDKENLTEELNKEYKIYSHLKQEYEKFIYCVGTNKLRPAISRIPNWIEYFKKLVDICEKSGIIVFTDNHYKLNSFQRMDKFVEELLKLKS